MFRSQEAKIESRHFFRNNLPPKNKKNMFVLVNPFLGGPIFGDPPGIWTGGNLEVPG